MTRPPESESEFTQAAFERNLLESAHCDAPAPGATERAWHRFATDAALLASLGAADTTPRGWLHSAAARTVKWTLFGAVSGASLTAMWLHPPASHPPAAESAMAALPTPVVTVPDQGSMPALAVRAIAAESTPPAANDLPRLEASSTSPPRAGSAAVRPRLRKRAPEDLLLAREVAALDAARTALAVGANASALRQIEQYHRDFPAGELSADADVVAIEALAAQGDVEGTRRAARRFLEQHAHDPHASRIRELVPAPTARTVR